VFLRPKQPNEGDTIFLQINTGKTSVNTETCIEKSLGEREKIVVPTGGILCFSKTLKVSRYKSNTFLMEGPGFLFFSVAKTSRSGFPRLATIGLILMAIFMLEILALSTFDLLEQ